MAWLPPNFNDPAYRWNDPQYTTMPQIRGALGRMTGGDGVLGGQSAWQQLLDPQVALPMAAALIAGRTPQESLAGAFAQAGPGLRDARKRKALNDLIKSKSLGSDLSPETQAYLAENPDFAQSVFASRMTPKNPVAVGAGDRLWDPVTRKFIDDGGGGSGAYGGTSMDAQNWNIILRGKVDSPEYAAAYNQLFETPKMAAGQGPNGEITQTPYYPPVPPGVRPPAGQAQPMAPQAGGGQPAPAAGPAPQAGAVRTAAPIVVGQRKPTETEIKGRTLYTNAVGDYKTADQLFNSLNSTGELLSGELGRGGRIFQSAEFQKASDATKNVVQSYIYAVSGQQAPEQEVARNMSLVMPAIGDSKEAVAAKRARLGNMMKAIEARANLPDDGKPHPELAVEQNEGGWTEVPTSAGPLKIRVKPSQ